MATRRGLIGGAIVSSGAIDRSHSRGGEFVPPIASQYSQPAERNQHHHQQPAPLRHHEQYATFSNSRSNSDQPASTRLAVGSQRHLSDGGQNRQQYPTQEGGAGYTLNEYSPTYGPAETEAWATALAVENARAAMNGGRQ
eukprot:GILJ01042433.1.p1 GENE.GILJ01042433.1~~GILJ01042433.1.p1  ORF type:complete len:164 (-),score=27.07 GILJ01042433.1:26-445(-)